MNNIINMEHYVKLAKSFSILCVCKDAYELLDDNVHIFKYGYVADNEKEAIELFDSKEVDIVFIDIDTPGINWVSIVHTLRDKQYDLPICIATDVGRQDRLATAITVGVTQCLFKPINKARLDLVIFDIVKKLQYKKDAKELYYKREEERLQNLIASNIDSIIKDTPFPMFIFSGKEILFTNKQMKMLFENKGYEYQDVTLKEIEELFENFDESMSFQSLPNGKHFNFQYNYKDKTLKKVFIPTKYGIELHNGGIKCSSVVLSDIAPLLMQIKVMQYQQSKAETYKDVIEELLIKNIFKTNDKSLKTLITSEYKNIDTNFKEEALLRKSVVNKVSAREFVQEISEDTYEEIKELEGTEGELQTAIDSFTYLPHHENIKEIAKLFNIYGSIIASLVEFVDLGHAVCS